jgi:hypothetical protein
VLPWVLIRRGLISKIYGSEKPNLILSFVKSYPLKLTSTSNVSGAGYFGIKVITLPDSDNLPSE